MSPQETRPFHSLVGFAGCLGFEFYHAVRKNDIKVKVCFITAFAISYEEISKILPPELVTRQNIIHKPIGIKELVNKINEILR
jgi:DNA-binding response OmpR family regulator